MPTKNSVQLANERQTKLREHLVELLNGGNAHAAFDDAVKDFPENLQNTKAEGLPHSAWMLVEHLRMAQWDILEFCRNPQYKAPKWPDEYWPKADETASAAAWNKSVEKFREDRKIIEELVSDNKTDLYAEIPWGEGQTVLREAMLVADHNGYHVAQLIDLRRLLGAWKEKG